MRILCIGTPTLVRHPLPDSMLRTLDEQLAKQAAAVLGYDGLAKELAAEDEATRAMAEVSVVFNELRIAPFTPDSVNSYKQYKVRKHDDGQTGARWQRYFVEKGHYEHGSYGTHPPTSYLKPIPTFVLSRAIELKQRLPEATFYVEALQIYEKPLPDPFLVMAYGPLTFYLEVWDKPEFEGVRQK